MPDDQNLNGLPDWLDRLLGTVLLVAGITFGTMAASMSPTPRWLAVAAAVTAALGGVFQVGLLKTKGEIK